VTWTYSGNPSASNTDKIRFLSGDTDVANPLATNEEIAFLLLEWNNDFYYAAAAVCDYAANKAAAKADQSKSVGDLSISTQYAALADSLHKRAHAIRDQAVMQDSSPKPTFNVDAVGDFKFFIDMDKWT